MKRFIPILFLILFLSSSQIWAQEYSVSSDFLSAHEMMSAEKPLPTYPKVARQKGWQGTVLLKVTVQEEGKPSEILIEQTSGFELLDQAAIKSVKNWKFRGLHSGKLALPYSLLIPIQFVLK